MTLRIYGIPRSRALRTLWMAHELGISFDLVEVPPGPEGSRKPQYLHLNPNGQVPFIDDDGLVLWESIAINLYLAKKHGDLAKGVYDVPQEIDVEVARLKLAALDIVLDPLTPEQFEYLRSWQHGT